MKLDITTELAELIDRIHAAALTVQTFPPGGPRGVYSLWPRYRLTWWDPGNEDSKLSGGDITRRLIAPPRFTPTPKQIDDCLPALALLDGCEDVQRRIVSFRAHQLWYGQHAEADGEYARYRGGWRGIGHTFGMSYEKARTLHFEAMRHALMKKIEGATLSLAS